MDHGVAGTSPRRGTGCSATSLARRSITRGCSRRSAKRCDSANTASLLRYSRSAGVASCGCTTDNGTSEVGSDGSAPSALSRVSSPASCGLSRPHCNRRRWRQPEHQGDGGERRRPDTEGQEPSNRLCGKQPARLVRGSSATTHCHAAPALLTREYQGDDRRCSLTSAALPALAPLDNNFHIRRLAVLITQQMDDLAGFLCESVLHGNEGAN